MMGDTKLYLSLLLCAIVLSDAQDDVVPCHLANRYKSFHKYEYLYEAESLNALNGAINGPKVSCKVEIEVPGTCHFIVHTSECTLSEVIGVDADGNPVFGPSDTVDTFMTQMEKHPLKVIVEDNNDIRLFPEDGELINILNIKRGIISALAVPGTQQQKNKIMPTIYGLCETDYTVNAREDIDTDVSLTRDLSKCDQFRPIKDHTSPLALITGMHYPLAHLIRSKQTCNYKFDNQQKYMISGVCTDDHLLVPFSHKGKHGVTSVGKQMLSLLGVTEYNDRHFDYNNANMKPLHFHVSIDMSPTQDANAILTVLRELAGLSQTANGHRRAYLAHKLIAMIRKMNADTLSSALPEALEISPSLTYQMLFQCGTPECTSAFMQILRTIKSDSVEIDAAFYAMGMVLNSSRVLVKEMLEMAKVKPSKLIYYATSNAVRRLYQAEGEVTPEIHAVADHVMEQIGDCTGEQEHIYLTLRVIANMAAAMGDASSALKMAVIQCINQPATSPEVQQAAIQVFRMTSVPEEGRPVLIQALLDGDAPVQKRIAAYLILMKHPQQAELAQLAAALPSEPNLQAKSFFMSHLNNILSSTSPETTEVRSMILDALQGNEVGNVMDPTEFSRNYKIGTIEGNVIFEEDGKLPKEVMLEMTLHAFGYDIDMVEVGMEGKGLEPTVEALFGTDGFFPDTVLKSIYFATDKMPAKVNEVLENIIPAMRNDRLKRQASKNIIKEVSKNVDKLIKNLKVHDAPEAMLYLRLLGAELGYIKTKDMVDMASSVSKMGENLLKMFPTGFIKNLFSSANNELFLHYIFMDNEFYLPTGPGFPLRVALSGTFTPGVKGGLKISPDMSEFAFMPSAGVEFVTEIGAHLPDYVHSGLEMHTNIYHESGLKATVAVTPRQIKLTIPALESPSKIISVMNSLVSATGGETKAIPAMGERIAVDKCSPFFPGLKYCTALHYSDAMSNDASPYFPLTGDSKFALELNPTDEVSEYTATFNYAHEENTDKVTLVVGAEGTSSEATATFMFNRKKYTISADLQIPDFATEAGIRIGSADPSNKDQGTHSIQIDLINKNINQVSLIGRAKNVEMKDALLEVQLLVPSLEGDAKVSASLKNDLDLTFVLESDLKLLDSASVQKLTLKYDDNTIEADIKSDISSNTKKKFDIIKAQISDLLDQHIGQTEMTVRDVLTSSAKATNTYLEASRIPFVQQLRVPAFIKIDMPETLFLNTEAGFKFHFNKNPVTVAIPLPLGGKSSKDLNFPSALTTPNLAVPQLGLELASMSIPLPEVFVPELLAVSLPILEKAEVTGKLSCNLYNLDATMSAGRDSDENERYSAIVRVNGTGPVDLLSLSVDGSAVLTGTLNNILKAEVNTAVNHKLIEAKVNVVEEITVVDKISLKSSSKLEATSPFDIKLSLKHTGKMVVYEEDISGESNLRGSFVAGSINGGATLMQSFALIPLKPEAKIHSLIEVESTYFQGQNKMDAAFANGALLVVSKSAAFNDRLTNNVEVALMKSKFAVKSDTSALGMKIHNTAELNIGAGNITIKIETKTNHSKDHINSLIIATASPAGVELKSDASLKIAENTATHKASITLNKDGLATSGTTSVNSFLNLENTFSGIVHSSKGSLSTETKGGFGGMVIENTNLMDISMSSLELASKSQVKFGQDVLYMYDISFQANPNSAHAHVNNNLKLTSDVDLKHTCTLEISAVSRTVQCSTNGKVIGAHLSHNTEMEILGLKGIRINSAVRFNSQPLRFNTALQSTAGPFSFNLDALVDGDGELYLYGKHSAQVYTKVLVKAEPLVLTHSHECRLSVTHQMNNDVTIETNFDNKVDTELSPSVQSVKVRMKTKINNNEISEELSAYNNHERIGLEVSGLIRNTAAPKSQDVSLSAFLKYDKNTDIHVINLPSLESLPAVMENIRIGTVNLLEALQNYIRSEEFVNKIQHLKQGMTDFVNELNLDERIVQLKRDLITLVENCAVTTKELKAAMKNAQRIMTAMATHVREVQELIQNGALSNAVSQKLTALREEYDARPMLLAVIEVIEKLTEWIDMRELNLQNYVTEVKQVVETYDTALFIDRMKDLIGMFEQLTSVVMKTLAQLDINGGCKAVYHNVRAFLVKYELDKRAAEFLDKTVELIKKIKLDKTIEAFVNHVKTFKCPFPHVLDDAITYLKNTDIKRIIEDVNESIEAFVKLLKSSEYNKFVDIANQKISEFTTNLNNLIVSLELSQKVEATREFLNYVLSSISTILENLRAKEYGYFKELKLNYLPDLSGIELPEITLPRITFPAIPKLSENNILLQIPDVQLPKIPSELVMPAFGKLYSEIRLKSPIYTISTSAEIQNSTGNEQKHYFTAFVTSFGESSTFEILNYNLDATAHIGVPKMSRIVIAETLKFKHSALTVEHQVSVTLYGFSGQATAHTAVKATTTPYKADIVNKAFIAVEDGMALSSDTHYKHDVNVPFQSINCEAEWTQKASVQQKGSTLTLKVENGGTEKFIAFGYSDEITHKSTLESTMELSSVKLTFKGDTAGTNLKFKKVLNVDAVPLRHIHFKGRIETESPFIKNSVAAASGEAHLGSMKIELEATHNTELVGSVSGSLSNGLHILVHPVEVIVDFKNKGNAKLSLKETLSAKIDLQNDYSVIINSKKQHINSAVLVRFNQHKYNHNFTIDNNNVETGMYVAANGMTDLEFLTVPVSIPEIHIPVIELKIPAINQVNLYEASYLKYLLTMKPALDVNAKVVYQKSKSGIIDLGFISVSALGNLISEMSFKSSIFNLIANAGIHGENDLAVRVDATSVSVYEELNASFEGTSRLTLKRGLKLATALSMKNAHIEGAHNSTIILSTDDMEASIAVVTFAKMNLPILSIEANHKLNADTITPNVASSLTIKHKFDIPVIKAVGNGNAEYNLKVEGTSSYISAEATTKGLIDGTFLETGIVKGDIHDEATLYMSRKTLRSKLKATGNVNVNYGELKVKFDVDENLESEARLRRAYTILNIISNNEVNIATFHTKGKHVAKASVDLVPLCYLCSLVTNVELNLSQTSPLGDLTISEKTVVDLIKEEISYGLDVVSPVYITNLAVVGTRDVRQNLGQIEFRSSAKSPAVLLEYDLNGSLVYKKTVDGSTATARAILKHSEFNLNFNNVISSSEVSHDMDMDITSPTFTDMNLHYTAKRNLLLASVSTPSTGLLGLQLKSEFPYQLTSRIYGHYTSESKSEIDILVVRIVAKEAEKIHLQLDYNMDASKEMIVGLKERMPAISSAMTNFAEKYGILEAANRLKTTVVSVLTEAYTVTSSHAAELSQLSILFRNVVVQHQKAIQNLLNAIVRFLRETKIKLPGMKESTLPEICKQIRISAAIVLEEFTNTIAANLNAYLKPVVKSFSIHLPWGEMLTGDNIVNYMEEALAQIMIRVKQMESLDVIIENLSQTLKEAVEETKQFVDAIRSDVLDYNAAYINFYYTEITTAVKNLIMKADSLLTRDNLYNFAEVCVEFILSVVNEFTKNASRIISAAPEVLVNVHNGKLEIDLPLIFKK